ncbi:MAG TPA: hypothetical protein VKV20_11445 [Ktedonobacteraceae bacterium]|nr:hypothetical protein [Ktedonobacteraceae bacterium]
MTSRQHQGDFTVTGNSLYNHFHYTGITPLEGSSEMMQEVPEGSPGDEIQEGHAATPHTGEGSIAYELLLLQQRLAAYEQLHNEEMAELRREVERLRRAFLQETNPHLRALSSKRQLNRDE